MKFTATSIPEILLIEPNVFGDQRGFFMETYRADVFAAAGVPAEFVQDNHSGSQQGVLRGFRLAVHQVHDLALVFADNTRVGLGSEVANVRRVPVISPRHPVRVVHSLLDDSPFSFSRHDERVEINLETISDRIIVDARS